MNIVHVITSLETGGAQQMLLKLVERMDRRRFEQHVISLMPPGPVAEPLRRVAASVESLHAQPRLRELASFRRLRRMIAERRPDLVQTWLYHSDILGGIAARTLHVPVLWNLRSSAFDPKRTKWQYRMLLRTGAVLSRHIPRRIICCSRDIERSHARAGYDTSRFVYIPNGFDVAHFMPNPEAREDVRRELGVGRDALLAGLVARFHPMKAHAAFLAAAARVANELPDVHFVLCGDLVTPDNSALRDAVTRHGLADRVHLLGRRSDMPRITAALDVACSSSAFGEGFPNVIGEAMACGVPCVATDSGDSASIVGDTGRVVAPDDPVAFADALAGLLRDDPSRRRALGEAARKRIEEHFEIGVVARQYEALYTEVAASG